MLSSLGRVVTPKSVGAFQRYVHAENETAVFCMNFFLCKLEGCLTVHLPREIMWNASLMQQGNFIDIFLVRHVSGTYAHHQEH